MSLAPRLPLDFVPDIFTEDGSQHWSVPQIKALLSSGAAGAGQVNRALHAAVAQNNKDMVKTLLLGGADPNRRLLGMPPLYQASSSGNLDVLRLLLAAGADPNAANMMGVTPLACCDDHDLSEALLIAGANPNCRDRCGNTPLLRACRAGVPRLALVESLLKHGAHVDQTDLSGRTPLHEACAVAAPSLVALLLASNASVEARDLSGATPLHVAAAADRRSPVVNAVLVQLLSAGASPVIRSPLGSPVSLLLSAFFGSRVQRPQNAAECVAALGTLLAAGGALEGVEEALRWLIVRAGLMDEITAGALNDTDLIVFLKRQSILRPQRVD